MISGSDVPALVLRGSDMAVIASGRLGHGCVVASGHDGYFVGVSQDRGHRQVLEPRHALGRYGQTATVATPMRSIRPICTGSGPAVGASGMARITAGTGRPRETPFFRLARVGPSTPTRAK
jgi:hypothetical protein